MQITLGTGTIVGQIQVALPQSNLPDPSTVKKRSASPAEKSSKPKKFKLSKIDSPVKENIVESVQAEVKIAHAPVKVSSGSDKKKILELIKKAVSESPSVTSGAISIDSIGSCSHDQFLPQACKNAIQGLECLNARCKENLQHSFSAHFIKVCFTILV